MAQKALPCPTLLRQLLRYDPDTGNLFWKPRPAWMFKTSRAFKTWNARYANQQAFTALSKGYYVGAVNYIMMKAHRVAWALHYGAWPNEFVDHINGNPSDNRIKNLRDVRQLENMRNMKTHETNASGHRGVIWHRKAQKWMAYIDAEKRYHLGLFEEKSEAIGARLDAEALHSFHENHGR